jgi:hypothetical protein
LLNGEVDMKNERKENTQMGNMNVDRFLKIYSNEGVIFEPLSEQMQEADVDEVYSIEEVSGVGIRSSDGQWFVREV